MTKSEARAYCLNLRKDLKADGRSKRVVDYIVNNKLLASFNNIGIYYPINNELDIRALKDIYNKGFYLPSIINNDIVFKRYTNKLKKAKFKTMEPDNEDIIAKSMLDCIIIPCVGIANNKRIGYGKGYYDRYLSDYKGFKIGICYKECIVDCQMDLYDTNLDLIIKG